MGTGPIPKYSPIPDATLEALAEFVEQHRRVNNGRSPKPAAWFRSDWGKYLVSLLISVLLAYGVMETRLAVLESRVNGFDTALAEIRSDIKTLLVRVR